MMVMPDESETVKSVSERMEEGDAAVIRSERSSIALEDTKKTWVECNNIGISFGKGSKKKEILKEVDAIFPPGRLTALMGSSGAGKTTLLNLCSCRGGGSVTGERLVNGVKATSALMKAVSKMVPQHDFLYGSLTAEETLMYAAKLTMKESDKEKREHVTRVLQSLDLYECKDVYVGDASRKGLSGGQQKRVSIGMELISNPSLLFLDEPTSGLDSKIAADVVDLLSALARSGRTIVCTIHQPSFQVFEKFDWLLLLHKGQTVFNGKTSEVSRYLEEIGTPCPEFVNPADHILNVVNQPIGELTSAASDYHQLFKQSSYGKRAIEDIAEQKQAKEDFLSRREKKLVGVDGSGVVSVGVFSQICTLFARETYVTMKDKQALRVRLIQLCVIGVIVGTIFFQIENLQIRSQEKLSVIFLVILFLGMSSIMQLSLALTQTKVIIAREFANGMYASGTFYVAKLTSLLLFQIIYAIIFSAPTYYMVGFSSPFENYLVFALVLVLISCIAGAIGLAFGLTFPTPQAAAAVTPLLVMPLAIFAGLFISKDAIPDYWIWLYYLSFFQYGLQILTVNEFHERDFLPCTPQAVANPQLGQCPYGACSSNPLEPQGCPGDLFLGRLGYDPDDVGQNFGILCGFFVAFSILGYLSLRRLLNKMR